MTLDYEDIRIPYKLQHVGVDSPELLTDGLFLFHNPYAKNKLDIRCFENTSVTQFFWNEDKLIHTSNTYPIVCRLNFSKILQQGFTDEYLLQEAKKEVEKRAEKIEEIMRIDLIRNKEVLDFVNQ